MTYEEAIALLTRHGQAHVLAHWDTLPAEARPVLLNQIESLDFTVIASMKAMLSQPPDKRDDPEPGPALTPTSEERVAAARLGADALRSGKVGVILVAGGQGTRLGFDGPKGTYPLAPLSNASLFEIHARKIAALEQRFNATVPFYVMTSEANDADTRAFFRDHNNFGLSADRVLFFIQGMLPALFPDGRLVMEAPGHLFMGPDGHGGILQALQRTHMLANMKERGLETLFYFQVDNPLIEIADPAFIGLHRERAAQFSLKVCAKRDPGEGIGVIVRHGQSGLSIVEYTELTEEQKRAVTPSGDLMFKYGSVAIHLFSLDFLIATAEAGLPLHKAHKKVPFFDGDRLIAPEKPNAFKFEKFIFDALPLAERALALEFDRADEFAPVKNATGADSPDTARRAMADKFARWFEACGVVVPRDAAGNPIHKIEIDPLYASNADELRRRLAKGFVITGDTYLTCL